MSKTDKVVLATGTSGLIGREALAYLNAAGYDVFALARKPGGGGHAAGVTWMEADLLDANRVEHVLSDIKPTHLLHFAWYTTGDYLSSNRNFAYLEASLRLLRLFAEAGGKRAVFPGTCFEYDLYQGKFREDDAIIAPKSVYGKCKHHLHELSDLFCDNNGIGFGWGRIFYVFGHNENPGRLTGQIIHELSRGRPVTIKSGRLLRDYMYTRDVAAAFVRLLDGDVVGDINICTGSAVRIEDLARGIGRRLGREELLNFVDDPGNQPECIVGDASRLNNEVGFRCRYTIEDALDEILCR